MAVRRSARPALAALVVGVALKVGAGPGLRRGQLGGGGSVRPSISAAKAVKAPTLNALLAVYKQARPRSAPKIGRRGNSRRVPRPHLEPMTWQNSGGAEGI